MPCQQTSDRVRLGIVQQHLAILFAFFTCGLLEQGEQAHITEEWDENGVTFRMAYSDDTYIIAVGISLLKTKTLLRTAFDQCHQWAKESGASFAVEKTNLIHFASEDQWNAPPMSSYIPGFDDSHETSRDDKEACLKRLGIIIQADSSGNPTWHKHIEHLQSQAQGLAKTFARMTKMTSGLDVATAVQVYRTGVLPAFVYGIAAWFEPPDQPWFLKGESPSSDALNQRSDDDEDSTYKPQALGSSDLHRKQWSESLNKLQNPFLRIVSDSLQQSRNHILRRELCVEQMDLLAYRIAVSIRANLLGTEVWQTIVTARDRVKAYARYIAAESRMTSVPTSIEGMDERAIWWKRRADQLIEKRLTHFNPPKVPEVPITSAVAADIDRLRTMYTIADEHDNVLTQKRNAVKRKFCATAHGWASNIMAQD